MIRIIILCMWISVLILDAASVDGKNNTIQKVIVTGIGINENKAIKNATKTAIQQIVGMYVVSDVLMKNSKLIKDEVLTQSNAYIKSFKILNKTKDEDGLFEVEAVVEVEVGKLTSNLGKINIATKSVGTSEFKAVALSGFSSSREFKAMLQEVVMEPIHENKKIYDIKVNSFKPFPNEIPYHWVSWGVNGRKLYEGGELLPFELSFIFGLNDNYINSIMYFFEHSSEQSSDFHIDNKNTIGIYEVSKTNPYPSARHLGNTFSRVLKTKKSYLLSSRNKKIFNANSKIDARKFGLIISLIDKNNEAIKSYEYGSSGYYGQNRTSILLKKKSMYKNKGTDVTRISGNTRLSRVLLGFDTGSTSSSSCLAFITNKQKLVTYLFLNEDEVSRVARVTIEAHWNK